MKPDPEKIQERIEARIITPSPNLPAVALTDEQRATALRLAALNLPIDQIAAAVGVPQNELATLLDKEMLRSKAVTNAEVAQRILHDALKAPNPASSHLWAKVHMRWKEAKEDTTQGQTINVVQFVDAPKPETREEWEARRKLELDE